MPAAFESFQDVRRHFGADHKPRAVPVNCGPCPRIEERTISEDDECRVWTDGWGITRRNLKCNESMSEFIQFPVRDRDDWQRFKSERLDPHHPDRIAGDWLDGCRQWTAEGVPIQLGAYPDVGIFGGLRWLLGDEECLLSFYTQPDLVHDIMAHLTNVYLAVFEQVVAAGVRVDVVHLWEDMAGRQGPLIGPKHFEQFMSPHYRRVRDFVDRHSIPLMSVDTDGRPDDIVPTMMAAGVNYLYPMEVAAGTDVRDYQGRFDSLAMMGGIDKRALAVGRDAIDAELARITPALRRGRYIPDLDHLVPDDVSWDNYCYFAEKLRALVTES
jgi:uroporphyrinogen decarboxylase